MSREVGTRWALGGHHLTLLSSWRHYWGLRPPLASLQQIHDDGDYYDDDDDDADIVIIIMLSSAFNSNWSLFTLTIDSFMEHKIIWKKSSTKRFILAFLRVWVSDIEVSRLLLPSQLFFMWCRVHSLAGVTKQRIIVQRRKYYAVKVFVALDFLFCKLLNVWCVVVPVEKWAIP